MCGEFVGDSVKFGGNLVLYGRKRLSSLVHPSLIDEICLVCVNLGLHLLFEMSLDGTEHTTDGILFAQIEQDIWIISKPISEILAFIQRHSLAAVVDVNLTEDACVCGGFLFKENSLVNH